MRRLRSPVVAITAAVAVLIAAAGIGWWILRPGDGPNTLTAQFDSAAGLYEGNVVAVLGMPVGKISRITPRGGYVEVEFTVDRNVKVPADAQAVTVSTSILSDRQIELTPPYRGGPILENHDTIGLTRTKTPIEFSRVLGVLEKVTKSLQGDGHGGGPIADILNGGTDIINGNGARTKHALDELSKALRLSSDGGASTREQLTTLVKNLSSLLDAAAANDVKLREFASTIHQLSEIMADEEIGSGSTGRKLGQLVQQASDLLDANRDTFKKAILNGNSTLEGVVAQQRDLAEILDIAPMLADNVYNVIDQTNGSVRARVLTDRSIVDSQLNKEICNMMGLRQLGCSTGTLQDYGPDFGLTYVLDGMAAMDRNSGCNDNVHGRTREGCHRDQRHGDPQLGMRHERPCQPSPAGSWAGFWWIHADRRVRQRTQPADERKSETRRCRHWPGRVDRSPATTPRSPHSSSETTYYCRGAAPPNCAPPPHSATCSWRCDHPSKPTRTRRGCIPATPSVWSQQRRPQPSNRY